MFAEQFYQFFRSSIFRSSRPEVFCEKGVLENFAIFTAGWQKTGRGSGAPTK